MNTQANQILDAIERAGDKGIENYKLAEIALKYSSRIAELRKRGYDIRARRFVFKGKSTGTYLYYLHKEPIEDPKQMPREIAGVFFGEKLNQPEQLRLI